VRIPANANGWLGAVSAKWTLDGSTLDKSPKAKVAALDSKQGFELPAGDYTIQAPVE
jgi:hypothetical protein